MPRGKAAPKRKTQPDPIYQDPKITKFINYVMMDGKKDKAKRIVYGALKVASDKLKKEPQELFEQALNKIRPEVEVRSRRVGGANYQVPVPVTRRRGDFLAMNWMIEVSRSRKGRSMEEKLANEIINAYNEEGDAVKKKENVLKVAEANRAFAHFKW